MNWEIPALKVTELDPFATNVYFLKFSNMFLCLPLTLKIQSLQTLFLHLQCSIKFSIKAT